MEMAGPFGDGRALHQARPVARPIREAPLVLPAEAGPPRPSGPCSPGRGPTATTGVEGRRVVASASIGIVGLADVPTDDPIELVRLADLTSYRSMVAGGGCHPAPQVGRRAPTCSPRRLAAPCLLADVPRALAASGLPRSCLCAEVTEAALAGGAEAPIAALTRLRSLGVRVAIDDSAPGTSASTWCRASRRERSRRI